MANPRELDKRRKSIRNIRKITRTMELIATARFRKAMDRASAATAYTNQIVKLVRDLVNAGVSVEHPLLERREPRKTTMLVLAGNRGFCGGFNSNVSRAGLAHGRELRDQVEELRVYVSGKRGVQGLKQGRIVPDQIYTHFEDRPRYDEVEVIANAFLEEYAAGKLDRLDVVYTKFLSISKQVVTVETLLPFGGLADEVPADGASATGDTVYEFLPSPESILEEVVPTSFRAKLFKCFLDSAVSEQIARMVAMKGATENAGDLIRQLSMQYNRARQGRITSELMDLIGGVEALS